MADTGTGRIYRPTRISSCAQNKGILQCGHPIVKGNAYNAVAGGTEVVDGPTATTVENALIVHAFTVRALG